MISIRSAFSIRKKENLQILLITLSWIFGLLSSLLVLWKFSDTLMCPLIFDRVSIVGMIVSLIFPLSLSYILLIRCNIYFSIPVIYIKAFLYMSCYLSITLAFGGAGWLVRTLILLSDSISAVLFLFLFYTYAKGNREALNRCFMISIFVLFLVGCFDYYIISPFTMMLLKY